MLESQRYAEVDVLIVGAGVAGLSVALGLVSARTVLVVAAGSGSTDWAQGGVAAAFDDQDEPADHAADTALAGAGLCSSIPLGVLVEEGPQRLAELIAAGASFDRGSDGDLERTLEGGHRRRRVVHAGGDATGAEVARTLRLAAEKAGVEVASPAKVTSLLQDEGGRVVGATLQAAGASEAPEVVLARAVVLATGGLGNLYESTTNPPAVTGDGLGLAMRAGASLVDLEFVQFHPTALHAGVANRGQLPLVTEAVRGEGAVLLDQAGHAIMRGRHPLADLAPRDIVTRAIDEVLRRDRAAHVWLDATSIGPRTFTRRFPTVSDACRRAGIDPATEPIPVAPAAHFLCGGVRTDRWGATDVPGLYAVGEVAATGVHGANRLASSGMLEGLVFGRRLAARLVLALPARLPSPIVPPSPAPMVSHSIANQIQTIMSRDVGIRRTADGLARAAHDLDSLGDGLMVEVARAVVAAATTRIESRGSHWRQDHPQTDQEWARRVVVRAGRDGRPLVCVGQTVEESREPR